MDVSKNRGTPKSSILIGFSIINHPFWGTPIFGNTHIDSILLLIVLDSLLDFCCPVATTFFSATNMNHWLNQKSGGQKVAWYSATKS